MPKKKSGKGITKDPRAVKRESARVTESRIHGVLPEWPGEVSGSNGTPREYPRIKNPNVLGEREKMLEKRAKLALKAFRIAYENHHRS
jgi:hypothetical protein